jgi:predicted ArsR family transcriptional regulator
MSVGELSRALGLTTVTVRHHLDGLTREDLVAEPSRRPRRGPGRPELTYTLTPKAAESLPRNYHELCRCLMETLSEAISPEQAVDLISRAGRRLGERHSLGPGARMQRRIDHAQAFLESRGYYPDWEPNAARLTLLHCPYREVAEGWPAVCRFDQALLEGLLSTRVEIARRIADNAPACTVTIHSAEL